MRRGCTRGGDHQDDQRAPLDLVLAVSRWLAHGAALAEPLVRSSLVAVLDELDQQPFLVSATEDPRWSGHSRRAVPTQRSAKELESAFNYSS